MSLEVSSEEHSEIHLDRDHPWPGLISFTEADHSFFFGREREVAELARVIRQETVTVFFGKSGLGKSSILRAGVSPLLRESEFVPIYVRLNHAEGAPPLEDQVEIRMEEVFEREQIEAPRPVRSETLWEYFHKRDCDWWDSNNRLVRPVLIFDQFEELLTVGQASSVTASRTASFLTELEDLIENRPPAALFKRFEADRALARQYDLERTDYRVVLTLREDFLPDLEGLRERLRAIMFNRFRLMPLNGEQAMEVILKPGGHLVEEQVALRIVDFVSSSERSRLQSEVTRAHVAKRAIEPALLSVILQELNNRRIQKGQERMTAELVGNAQAAEIFDDFYLRGLAGMDAAVREFIEDCLLTSSGARNRIAEEDALTKKGITPDIIATLIDRRIVQREMTGAAKWLELTHDTLADVVRADRAEHHQRRQVEESERQRADAEEQTRRAREREAEANERLKRMRRERRLGIVALVLTLSFAGSLCLAGFLVWGRLKTGADAQLRSGRVLQRAVERLAVQDNDRRDMLALRHLARALRIDPANREAAKLLCNLLVENDWCPPISPPLRYAGTPLLCAAFSPQNREIIAIAQDGNLVRWDAQTFASLPSISLVPEKAPGENKAVLSSAAVSDDGKRILLALLPAGRETARVWAWSDSDNDYHPSGAVVNFRDTVRSASWSRDGNLLFAFPMRFDQPACRVFSFDRSNYVEKGAIPNVTAGAISPDDRWLATAAQGGKLQIWNAQTLAPEPETPALRTTLAPEELNPETRIALLSFSGDGQKLGATAMREPARLWDLRTGKSRVLRPKSSQDQIMRIDFATGLRGEQLVAAGMNGMVGIWDLDKLDQLRSEPICTPEAMVYPTFNSDGTKVVTLSGPFWMTMDTVRVWDTSFRNPISEVRRDRFDGKSAPAWLSELAEAIIGMRVATDEDDSPPPVLSDLRKKYAGSSFPDQYAIIWNRFLLRGHNTSEPATQP
jgi:WD40 repeat protein